MSREDLSTPLQEVISRYESTGFIHKTEVERDGERLEERRMPSIIDPDISEEEYEEWNRRYFEGYVKEVIGRYKPGEYILARNRPIYLEDFWHDYILAGLRKDKEIMEEVLDNLRAWLEDAKIKARTEFNTESFVEELKNADLANVAMKIPETLFVHYRRLITIPGWRMREKETIDEGRERKRRMDHKSERLWSYEESRWDLLDLELTSMWNEAKRKNDKLVTWVVREVKKLVIRYWLGFGEPFSEEGKKKYSWADDAIELALR